MLTRRIFYLLSILYIVYSKFYTEDIKQQKKLWQEFKLNYSKSYESQDEELKRFNIFLNNLQIIDERNNKERSVGSNAYHHISKFTDLSIDEFKLKYLNNIQKVNHKNGKIISNFGEKLSSNIEYGKTVNWAGIYTTPVKNQGDCGGCWAFSAVEQIESDTWREQGLEYILSVGQVIECSESDGCNGGTVPTAYDYVQSNGGIEPYIDYASQPYTNEYDPPTCDPNPSDYVTTISGYSIISSDTTEETEDDMTIYVQTTGPLSICVEASMWQFYSKGTFGFCGFEIDHCVQAVGVKPLEPTIKGYLGYWIIRNSWGADWGMDGYIQLPWGENACGITYLPTYTTTVLV